MAPHSFAHVKSPRLRAILESADLPQPSDLRHALSVTAGAFAADCLNESICPVAMGKRDAAWIDAISAARADNPAVTLAALRQFWSH